MKRATIGNEARVSIAICTHTNRDTHQSELAHAAKHTCTDGKRRRTSKNITRDVEQEEKKGRKHRKKKKGEKKRERDNPSVEHTHNMTLNAV